MRAAKGIAVTRSDTVSAWILRRNSVLLIAVLGVFLALAAGLQNLRFANDNRNFLGDANAEFVEIRKIEDAYAQSTTVMIMVIPPEGQAFAPETLTALRRMTDDSWQTPYVLRVDSTVNYAHSYAEGEDIFVEALIPEDGEITPDMATRFADVALTSEELVNRLISADGRA